MEDYRLYLSRNDFKMRNLAYAYWYELPWRVIMNIKEFSSLVGLSAHTLRYYEKIGLLKHVHRNASGHRVYSAKDLSWISFVKRLKETAMPLEEILEYAKLREVGSESVRTVFYEVLDKARELDFDEESAVFYGRRCITPPLK